MTTVSNKKPLESRIIVLGVSGSISAYKSPQILRELSSLGAKVRVCLSSGGEKFIGAETFRGLTGEAPYASTYAADSSLGGEPHIKIAEGCELILIAPASASMISRLAYGPADEPVSLTALNVRAPLFIAPAMSEEMWTHPQTQDAVKLLQDRGAHFIGPDKGPLASGRVGLGRLSDPIAIAGIVRKHFDKASE